MGEISNKDGISVGRNGDTQHIFLPRRRKTKAARHAVPEEAESTHRINRLTSSDATRIHSGLGLGDLPAIAPQVNSEVISIRDSVSQQSSDATRGEERAVPQISPDRLSEFQSNIDPVQVNHLVRLVSGDKVDFGWSIESIDPSTGLARVKKINTQESTVKKVSLVDLQRDNPHILVKKEPEDIETVAELYAFLLHSYSPLLDTISTAKETVSGIRSESKFYTSQELISLIGLVREGVLEPDKLTNEKLFKSKVKELLGERPLLGHRTTSIQEAQALAQLYDVSDWQKTTWWPIHHASTLQGTYPYQNIASMELAREGLTPITDIPEKVRGKFRELVGKAAD